MRVVKLLLAFVAIAGGIFFALNWNSISGWKFIDNGFGDEDKLDISKECDKIREAWERCDGWDESVYEALRSDIDQSKSMRLFSSTGYNTVNNCLRENSINKACDGYHKALGNTTSFSHDKVVECYKGVERVKELEQLDNEEPRIKEITALHEYYKDVKNFTGSKHYITPKFNTETTDWTSFAIRQRSVLTYGKSLLNDARYNKVKHIPGFAKGLDSDHLKNATERWRSGFYSDLSLQIVAHFKTLEPTSDRVNLLNQIYNNFVNQEDESGVQYLADFVVSYEVPEDNSVSKDDSINE